MKLKFLLSLTSLCCANVLMAQYAVKDVTFSPNGISNQGNVSGYGYQTGPYAIWMPDSNNTIVEIGGIAPGSGVGGQARSSANGDFISGTSAGTNGPEMSRYVRSTNKWTTIGSLGFQLDGTVSGGFAISGDGNTVAGLSWTDTTGGCGAVHAVAWNQSEGIMDLGSLFSDKCKSTRANAINQDGSVVIGWQDFSGPWKSAVWRKNPAGGYYPNHYLLINPAGDPNDEYNQLGECSAISADGTWIGGYGDYANNNEPWIWSEATGVINLGTLPNVGNGYVAGMSADASVVVGWFDGQLWGDPQTPFIWTKTGGLQELNTYINTVLGKETTTYNAYTAECISPNGRYVAGYGVNMDASIYFVYRIDLSAAGNGLAEVKRTNTLNVYPNPTSDFVTIENSTKAVLTITNMAGVVVDTKEINGKHVIDVSSYASGVYTLSLQSDNLIQTQRIIKN